MQAVHLKLEKMDAYICEYSSWLENIVVSVYTAMTDLFQGIRLLLYFCF